MRLSVVDQGHIRSGQPGTIGIAALFTGDPLDLAEVRSRVGARWGGLDRMGWVLRRPAGPAALTAHHWLPAGPFDPATHVVPSGEGLESVLTAGVSRPLPAGRPLWRLVVAENATADGEHALVLLAHHGLLDGRSLETLVRLLMDDAVPPRPAGPALPRPSAVPAVLRRELHRLGARGQAFPVSPAEARPSLAVVRLPPEVVGAARHRPVHGRGATLNELLLASLAGALRSCYGPLPGWPDGPTPVYATLPVDLRSRRNTHELGNIVTALRVPLPVGLVSAADRLRVCQDLVAALQDRCDAHRAALPTVEAAARLVPGLSNAMARRLVRPDVTPTVCTAFKWRDNPCALHGRRLTRIVPLPQLNPPGTANLCLVQTADAYTLTVVSHLRPADAAMLGDAVTREFEELAALPDSAAADVASPTC
ncbi:wax ester/triacylglycerol synthase domain-containing protein [Streptomyces poonensis]|uniref:O-acyltransferase WSD1-like N-terminal domain-containing protein n=1 Tax=Streptomyces poonensis TaxID=68255 RepID=A0A918UF86_9ACTN|nr:wax ester/triacylglycerol synthase domain-containing protein [Streptomyces poonensis]GGY99081.1 hypothetical protein GCM10010365_17210 [Streptomyces poonensis]